MVEPAGFPVLLGQERREGPSGGGKGGGGDGGGRRIDLLSSGQAEVQAIVLNELQKELGGKIHS